MDDSLNEYPTLIKEALGAYVSPYKGIMDIDFEQPAIQYLYADLISDEIIISLEKDYGDRWYREKCAIEALKDMWRKGGAVTPANCKYATALR